MAIVPMQKVAVLAHHELQDQLIQLLHEKGVMHISKAKEITGEVDHTELNFRVAELQFAIDTLRPFAAKETEAAILKAQAAKPEDVLKAVKNTNVRRMIDRLHELEKEHTEDEHLLQEKSSLKQATAPWVGLPFAMDSRPDTLKTATIVGIIPVQSYASLEAALQASLPVSALNIISSNDSVHHCTTTVLRTKLKEFEEIATGFGWTTAMLPRVSALASHAYEEASSAIKEVQKRKENRQKEYERLSVELPKLAKISTFMHWLTEKQTVKEALAKTKNTITIMGWIPRQDLNALEADLHRFSSAIAIVKVKPDDGEEAPIKLEHPKFITPFVSVTSLYGLPMATEMDPTAALSPFFILFFALCLTDAGYGLVLALIFGIFLALKKPKAVENPLAWLLFFSGIMSIVVGIPFGGYFGLTPDLPIVPDVLTKTGPDGALWFKGQIWNLSTQSGINFLQNLALILGLTHLLFGMFLSGYHKWVHGQKMAAFWQDFTSHLLIGAIILAIVAPLLPVLNGLQAFTTYIVYGALALAIWGKGYGNKWYLRPIFGVLGIVNLAIGMLSNGLSYLRILALGLVTGAMALAVNQVAIEMGKLFPIYLAVPVIILIFLGGHLVSIALNALGSFIHSGRLQFIEFFSQFFEGGGEPFQPFRRS